MPPRHDRETLKAFLDADFRQVWAVDRVTGEAKFLPEGQAVPLRPTAKREWRCPVPGCTVEITTISGSRRHHFRHNAPAPHPSDGESEAHLAAKAMLKEWAQAWMARHGITGSAVEEESVKDPTTSLHRIADVMVTWPNATKTAFEVEYKPYTPEAWATKQNDYDTKNVACAWLLGHTKVKLAPGLGEWPFAVRVPALAAAIAGTGRHVLFVNPMTRQIGTLAGDREFTSRLTAGSYGWEAWLALDDLADCDLDPELGLITPTMARIDEATAAREKAEHERAQREAANRAKAQAKQDQQQKKWARIEAQNEAAWQSSHLLQMATARWGKDIPALLTDPTADTWGIHALPVHWHTAIYLGLIDGHPAGHTFTITDCYTTLAREGIDKNWDNKKAFKALIHYLNTLQNCGLVRVQKNERGFVTHIETLGIPIEQAAQAAKLRRLLQVAHAPQAHPAGPITRKERAENKRREAQAQWQQQDERLRNIDAVKANQNERWERSDIRRVVADTHGGDIPAAIAWPGGSFLIAIDASPAHWHAHIYMRHVHDQPAGTPIDARTAAATLRAVDIPIPGNKTAVLAAVEDYLHNLMQRGILARPGGNHLASGYVVRTDALRHTPPPESTSTTPVEEPQESPMW